MTLIPEDRDEMVKLEFERAWKMMNEADYHNTYELEAYDASELYSEAKEFLINLQEYA